MGRKNRKMAATREKASRASRRIKRMKATGTRITYCKYERDKEALKKINYLNPSPKLTKVRFRSRKDATRLLEHLRDKGREESRVYRCQVCHGYHLTKTPIRYWERPEYQ